MAQTIAILAARLIFAGLFVMAALFKLVFVGIPATAAQIGGVGIANPTLFAWLSAFLDLGIAFAFLTGLFFADAAVVAIAYVLVLGFAFHGPKLWAANQMEFGFFIDHFTFIAGLLFAAVHGPGNRFVVARIHRVRGVTQ